MRSSLSWLFCRKEGIFSLFSPPDRIKNMLRINSRQMQINYTFRQHEEWRCNVSDTGSWKRGWHMTLTAVFAAAISRFFCKMTHFQLLIVQEVNIWFVGDTWHLPSSAPLQRPHHTASSLMFSLLSSRNCSAVKSGRLQNLQGEKEHQKKK